jgi:hypothetical protein
VLPPKDSPQSPDDEKILKYAGELFRQLGITRPEPDSVAWDDTVDPGHVTVRFGEVMLPRRMIGRLTAEDWRPLLASAIIYGNVLSRDKNRGTLIRLVLPLGLAEIPLLFTLLQIFRLSRQFDIGGLLLATIIIYLVYASTLLALWIGWYWRSFTYKADQRVASIIGREMLLAALVKYGETIAATGYPRKLLHLWPTVGQRIVRLQRQKA